MNIVQRRRTASDLLLDSALIVFSILLAFALNGWWQAHQDRQLAEKALTSIEIEIAQNRSNVLAVMPYHQRLHKLIAGLSAAGSIRTFEDVRGLEGFDGFQPAFLTTTAWSTAINTGALNHMDYELVNELSAVYAFQERFAEYSDFRHLLAPAAMADANIAATVFSAEIYLIDVLTGARELVDRYNGMLDHLQAR
jgi:hypothetical protein